MKMLIAMMSLLLVPGVWAAGAAGGSEAPTEVGQIGFYACPSHPEFQATWPALCPTCGKALQEAQPSADSPLHIAFVADRDRGEAAERQRQATTEERREQQARAGTLNEEARERQRQATAEERREQQARAGTLNEEARERQRQATAEERREQQARAGTLNEEARERQRNEELREQQRREEYAERGYYPYYPPDNRYYYPDQGYSQGGYYPYNAPSNMGRSYYNPDTGYYFYPDTGYYFNPTTGQGYYSQGYNPTYVYPDQGGYYPPYGYTYPNEEARERANREQREERRERDRD